MTRISFRCSEEFLAAVDRARGDVPRELWVRGVVGEAVEQVLGDGQGGAAGTRDASSEAVPAPAEQPPAERPLSRVEAFRRATQR